MNIAVITGASSGLGEEFVKQLDKNYSVDEVWVIARRTDRLQSLQKYTKAKVVPLSFDLTNDEDCDFYRKLLAVKVPSIKLLINGAGFGKFERFADGDINEHTRMISLNCHAVEMITYMSIPYMSQGSDIVQISSCSAFQPVPYISLYAATKSFVLSFSRSLNVELKKRRIRVLALCPYWVKTEFFNTAQKNDLISKFEVMYTPEFVVNVCYKHLKKHLKKDVCTPGKYTKLIRFASKLFPKKFVMKIWLKMQSLE